MYHVGSRFLIFCCRFVLTGGGASGARPISRLQQTDPARAKHDTEGRGRLRSGFHSAHQCGKIFYIYGWYQGSISQKDGS